MAEPKQPPLRWWLWPVVALIQLYRYGISPLLGTRCRFEPSCSAYAVEALRQHGLWRGLKLSVLRLSRCQPWGGHGFDPVPPKGR